MAHPVLIKVGVSTDPIDSEAGGILQHGPNVRVHPVLGERYNVQAETTRVLLTYEQCSLDPGEPPDLVHINLGIHGPRSGGMEVIEHAGHAHRYRPDLTALFSLDGGRCLNAGENVSREKLPRSESERLVEMVVRVRKGPEEEAATAIDPRSVGGNCGKGRDAVSGDGQVYRRGISPDTDVL